MLEGGITPVLPPAELQEIGYNIAACASATTHALQRMNALAESMFAVADPLTLLSASIKAMKESLERLKAGEPTDDLLEDWGQVRQDVGFEDYYEMESRYAGRRE
jgi:2-methylisocitrate lyase-like PEP mutase family enzyme